MIVDDGSRIVMIVPIVVRSYVEPWANGWNELGKCVNEVEANQIVAEAVRISEGVGQESVQVQVAEDRNAVVPIARHRVVGVLPDVKRFLNDALF